jgi:two-component system chemotaxis sensor kinase CheA
VADDPENLNAIFRAAHTIKGSAGIFGLDDIVGFTHLVENLLDRLRAGTLSVEPELTTLLLQCCDQIAHLVDASQSRLIEKDSDAYAVIATNGDGLTAALIRYLENRGQLSSNQASASQASAASVSQGSATNSTALTATGANEVAARPNTANSKMARSQVERLAAKVASDNWHISVRFGENSFRDGMDPITFLRFLGTLGEVVHIIPLTENLPALAQFNPESCYLGFEIQFDSTASKQEIEDVFEFMREDGFLHILPPHSALGDYLALIDALPEVDLRLGEILLECGALTRSELASALLEQDKHADTDKVPLGEIIAEQDERLTPVLEAALQKQNQVRESVARDSKTLRVDADKLDLLINRVGELVTAGAGTLMLAENMADSQLVESVMALNGLLEEVREAALKLRMVPIGATFSKFQRVARDTAKELGKDIELVIQGADTELDKSVVEKMGDPLMHLVRNALDHGIEPPDIRRQKGKPEKGELRLNAYHDSGSIVIEVSDDGKGLNPEHLRQKAIEKGLIDETAALSREDMLNLIFLPGFSTAAVVSNISGRGVGMDVVKRNITSLRGQINLVSQLDVGTTIQIMLPLTLAIIDGFLIGVAQDAFVIPLELVQECVELSGKYQQNAINDPYINLRGEVLPLINLRQHFKLDGLPSKRQSVVVVRAGNQRCGLVVDRLMGEFQTVIKPLGVLFGGLRGIGGSTIMGDGRVALILDVPNLVQGVICGRERYHA